MLSRGVGRGTGHITRVKKKKKARKKSRLDSLEKEKGEVLWAGKSIY